MKDGRSTHSATSSGQISRMIGWLLGSYILAISMTISGLLSTFDSAHSWWLFQCCPTGYSHLLSHSVTLSWLWANQSLPYPNNAERQAKKWQISILKALVWLDQVSNPWAPDSNPGSLDSPISQNGRWPLYKFGHPDWFETDVSVAVRCISLFQIKLNYSRNT